MMINSMVLVHKHTVPTEQPPPTYADRGRRVVSAADPYSRVVRFPTPELDL
jgi:hypothetical protein